MVVICITTFILLNLCMMLTYIQFPSKSFLNLHMMFVYIQFPSKKLFNAE